MALGFGRKKATPDAEEAPVSPAATPLPSAALPGTATPAPNEQSDEPGDDVNSFDLDAFATDLDSAPAGAKTPATRSGLSLDEELEALNNPASFGGESTVEAVSEPEPLDLNKMFEVETRQAIASGKIPAPAPFVPASMANADGPEPEPFYDPQIALPTDTAPKKKLPLVPIIGVLAVVGLCGGAALFLSKGTPPEEEVPVTTDAPPRDSAPPPPGPPPPTTPPPPAAGAPPAPVVAPGVAATVPLTPQLQNQLKALWKKGATAKAKQDYAGARAAWQQALKLRPGHPGFADSIAKLPPARRAAQ